MAQIIPPNWQKVDCVVVPAREVGGATCEIILGDWGEFLIEQNRRTVSIITTYLKENYNYNYTTNMWQNYYLLIEENRRFYRIATNDNTSLVLAENAQLDDCGVKKKMIITPMADEIIVSYIPMPIIPRDPVRKEKFYIPIGLYEESPPLPIIRIGNFQLGVLYEIEIFTFYNRKRGSGIKFNYLCGADWVGAFRLSENITILSNPFRLRIPRPDTQSQQNDKMKPIVPDEYEIRFIITIDNKDYCLDLWKIKAKDEVMITPLRTHNYSTFTVEVRGVYHDLYMVKPDDPKKIQVYSRSFQPS